MSGTRRAAAMMVIACVTIAQREAAAQPAVTEPWPAEEEVSDAQQIGGTLTAFLLGFGVGHAVEGRWASEGWKYTLVDSAATASWVTATVAGIACERNCEVLEAMFFTGLMATVISRYAQIYDAAWGARKHNQRLYERRKRAGTVYADDGGARRDLAAAERATRVISVRVTPVLAPTADGVLAGAALRF